MALCDFVVSRKMCENRPVSLQRGGCNTQSVHVVAEALYDSEVLQHRQAWTSRLLYIRPNIEETTFNYGSSVQSRICLHIWIRLAHIVLQHCVRSFTALEKSISALGRHFPFSSVTCPLLLTLLRSSSEHLRDCSPPCPHSAD